MSHHMLDIGRYMYIGLMHFKALYGETFPMCRELSGTKYATRLPNENQSYGLVAT